ncbi:hypothetical protein [Streptomyces sp. NPDC086787]|uniref:hypothetical protein n=1 Tax=Streptomyces sp. NPDC086787 TaxID=3365759 RepID=UPI003811EF3C
MSSRNTPQRSQVRAWAAGIGLLAALIGTATAVSVSHHELRTVAWNSTGSDWEPPK